MDAYEAPTDDLACVSTGPIAPSTFAPAAPNKSKGHRGPP
ncbi:Hypothetical protein A7982_07245 [Minicystis rosea]|nr:Hypothetical protein A7982_07245 [Minicystis rosea]